MASVLARSGGSIRRSRLNTLDVKFCRSLSEHWPDGDRLIHAACMESAKVPQPVGHTLLASLPPARREVAHAGRLRSARDVFVIHGRDEPLRERFFDFLRALDLRPMDWETIVAVTGQTAPALLTVVRAALARAQATVVLLSPDDMVQLHPSLREPHEQADELAPMMQARPNVLIELGMALSGCPDRTIVVEIGQLRPVADLGGLNVIRFDGSKAALGKVVQRLRLAGCDVDDRGSDWHTERRFADADAYGRRPAEG